MDRFGMSSSNTHSAVLFHCGVFSPPLGDMVAASLLSIKEPFHRDWQEGFLLKWLPVDISSRTWTGENPLPLPSLSPSRKVTNTSSGVYLFRACFSTAGPVRRNLCGNTCIITNLLSLRKGWSFLWLWMYELNFLFSFCIYIPTIFNTNDYWRWGGKNSLWRYAFRQ